MIPFLLGCLVGGTVGLLTAALCRAAADGDRRYQQDVLEVLCRVFDDGADVAHDEWLTWYQPREWLSPYRALGAFIRTRLERHRRLPREVMG